MKKKPTKKSLPLIRVEQLLPDTSPLKRRFIWKTFEPDPKSVADICREINQLETRKADPTLCLRQEERIEAAIQALKWAIGIDKRTPRETFEP